MEPKRLELEKKSSLFIPDLSKAKIDGVEVEVEQVISKKISYLIVEGVKPIGLAGDKGLYVRIPKEIRDEFNVAYNCDLLEQKKQIRMSCEFADEARGIENVRSGNFEVKLIYVIKRKKKNKMLRGQAKF